MSDGTERAGLGKVIYSVDEKTDAEENLDEVEATTEIEEGSKESFPASDPPSYMGGTSTATD